MNLPIRSLLVAVALAGLVSAQQPNSFNASMQVNGVAGPPYPITGVGLPRGLPQNVVITSLAPNAPFILFGAASLHPAGSPVLGGQLLDVDIDNGGFILLDGSTNPTTFNTGPTGNFNNTVVLPSTAAIGTQAAFQSLVADPTVSIYAVTLTAATEVVVSQGLTIVPITFAGSEPGRPGTLFSFVPYGMTFPFYSNTYTSMFVNSDGHCTFGANNSDFTPTPTEFRTGPPRIAPFWTDLDPGVYGASVTVTVDQSGLTPFPTVTVDWVEMAEWSNTGARHTFQLVLNMVTGDIQVNHSPFNVAMIYDQLMGIVPGGNTVPAGGWPVQYDLSTLPGTPYFGAVNEAFWEWYGLVGMTYYSAGFHNPWDMVGTTTNWLAISPGVPNMAQYYGN